MQDLNKARDEALAYVIQDIENRETDPLTADEKKRVTTLIEDAMLAPVKDYDDLSDYVNGELCEEALTETSSCFSQGKETEPCEAR
ncbi:hypothetical protein ES703_14182 [subsurface metagenome]